jgi:hypothetical protein
MRAHSVDLTGEDLNFLLRSHEMSVDFGVRITELASHPSLRACPDRASRSQS